MEIKRIGTQASAKGPSDWFTGTVRIEGAAFAPRGAAVIVCRDGDGWAAEFEEQR